MAAKCVHKGCGKIFTDPEEECIYHPGPPVFHEGQKGRTRVRMTGNAGSNVDVLSQAGNAASRAC